MSKRYGRNQKRAHRTRIAALEAMNAKLQKNHDQLWRVNRELVDEIACAKRIVGEYCIAFEPRTQKMGFKSQDFVTIMNHERDFNSGVSKYWDFRADPMLNTHRIEQIRLPIMCALADQEIRMARHVLVSYDGKAYGYAVDAIAWMRARYPQEFAKQVAERMGHFIYEELSKNIGRPPEPRRTHTRDEPDPYNRRPFFEFNPMPDFLRK